MGSEGIVRVDEDSFEAEVVSSEQPVLVDFVTAWCPPCRALAPVVSELARRHAGRLKVVTVDGEESPAIASRYGVRGFPTLILLREGRELGRRLGMTPLAKLEALVAEHL